MATTTNYIHDLASMRQFIRSLTFGNHNRGKVTARGIKGSQHDDIIRRLDYFGIIPHIYTKRIGKASIHHLSKDDFIDGYNYLNNLYKNLTKNTIYNTNSNTTQNVSISKRFVTVFAINVPSTLLPLIKSSVPFSVFGS